MLKILKNEDVTSKQVEPLNSISKNVSVIDNHRVWPKNSSLKISLGFSAMLNTFGMTTDGNWEFVAAK